MRGALVATRLYTHGAPKLDGVEQVDYRYHADADGGGLAEFDVAYPASAPPTERATWSASCDARPFWQDYRGNIDL